MPINQIPQLPLSETYLFDNLPLDIIQYEIHPYLDYNSKVTMNCMLPPQDRISSPLSKGIGINIVVKILALRLKRQLKDCIEGVGLIRTRNVMKLFRDFGKYYIIFQYCKKARDANIVMMQEFGDPQSQRYGSASKYVREKVSAMAAVHLANIEERPYISEFVQLKCCDHWSAVGSGKHHIVRAFGGSPIIYKQSMNCYRLPGFDEWDMENYSH